jgi:hypothetical protein
MRSIVEIIKEVSARIGVAEHAKFHRDDNLKNLQPHMALVGGVEQPQAQRWLDAPFRSEPWPPAANVSSDQYAYSDATEDSGVFLNVDRGSDDNSPEAKSRYDFLGSL